MHADIVPLPGPVVDTMGAGDATLSAVVHHMAQHGVPPTTDAWTTALDEAMIIAAATVRHEGALLRMPHARAGVPELTVPGVGPRGRTGSVAAAHESHLGDLPELVELLGG